MSPAFEERRDSHLLPGQTYNLSLCGKNQSAAVPFGVLFLWFVHNSAAMESIAQ
jgi:hypothetical protein